MTAASPEQRNPYKGDPPRPWVRLRLIAEDGSSLDRDLVVDTGNPLSVIIDPATLLSVGHSVAPSLGTNFGTLQGAALHVVVSEFGTNLEVTGYASDAVLAAVQTSHPDFQGMVGLPLLRMMEYGGDADGFWIRPAVGTP